MIKAYEKRVVAVLVTALCVAVALTGCSTLKSGQKTTSKDTAATPPPTSTAVKENTPVYYDFGDIMLPRELKVDKDDSFVMTSGGMTTGVLALKGGVDVNSLVTFFENKMPVDGWRQMGAFRSARSIMLFEKRTRWCVISIADGQFSTKVEIWVAPIKQDTGTALSR